MLDGFTTTFAPTGKKLRKPEHFSQLSGPLNSKLAFQNQVGVGFHPKEGEEV